MHAPTIDFSLLVPCMRSPCPQRVLAGVGVDRIFLQSGSQSAELNSEVERGENPNWKLNRIRHRQEEHRRRRRRGEVRAAVDWNAYTCGLSEREMGAGLPLSGTSTGADSNRRGKERGRQHLRR